MTKDTLRVMNALARRMQIERMMAAYNNRIMELHEIEYVRQLQDELDDIAVALGEVHLSEWGGDIAGLQEDKNND